MARWLTVLICIACVAVAPPTMAATIQTDASPYIDEGRVMVPMRALFEWIGATVEYDAASGQVVATHGNDVVRLRPGRNTASVNGSTVTMASAATRRDGRTFVPLRFVCEAMGASVDWDASSRTVTVASGNRKGTLKVASPESAKLKSLLNALYRSFSSHNHGSYLLIGMRGFSGRYDRRGNLTVLEPVGASLDSISTRSIYGDWALVGTDLLDASKQYVAQGSAQLWRQSGGNWRMVAADEGVGIPDEQVRHVPRAVIDKLGVPLMSDNY